MMSYVNLGYRNPVTEALSRVARTLVAQARVEPGSSPMTNGTASSSLRPWSSSRASRLSPQPFSREQLSSLELLFSPMQPSWLPASSSQRNSPLRILLRASPSLSRRWIFECFSSRPWGLNEDAGDRNHSLSARKGVSPTRRARWGSPLPAPLQAESSKICKLHE